MKIEEIKKVFSSRGATVAESCIDGYYVVFTGLGCKCRSLRSITCEAEAIIKRLKVVK